MKEDAKPQSPIEPTIEEVLVREARRIKTPPTPLIDDWLTMISAGVWPKDMGETIRK